MKYISIIILTTAFIGCRNESPQTANMPDSTRISGQEIRLSDEQLKAVSLETVSMERKAVSGVLRLNGKVDVDPDHLASLSSAFGGYVKSVNVLPGKAIRKGETVLVLEDNQFIQLQQEYLTVKAQLLSAEPDYIRQKELNANKSTSDKATQLAETEYRSLLAEKTALEEKLRLIHIDPHALTHRNIRGNIPIPAPFDGVISKVLVNRGKYVAPSDVLVELINVEGLMLRIRVFEKDWPKIAVGQTLEAFTNQEPDRKIPATIVTTGNAINADGSVEIIAKVGSSNQVKLVAGLYVNALLTLDRYETYTLPEEAVVSFEGKNYVFETVGPNSFRLLEVDMGTSDEGIIEMIDAEQLLGKTLVGKGAYTLLMAAKNKADE